MALSSLSAKLGGRPAVAPEQAARRRLWLPFLTFACSTRTIDTFAVAVRGVSDSAELNTNSTRASIPPDALTFGQQTWWAAWPLGGTAGPSFDKEAVEAVQDVENQTSRRISNATHPQWQAWYQAKSWVNGGASRVRNAWLLWCIVILFASGITISLMAFCLFFGHSSSSSSAQRREESGALRRPVTFLAKPEELLKIHTPRSANSARSSMSERLSGADTGMGTTIPLTLLQHGYVPPTECRLSVFREWSETDRDAARFKVRRLDDHQVPMQAHVYYAGRRLSMFTDAQAQSPCCYISGGAVLEVREADGSHYAMLEVEPRGSFSLTRRGNPILMIDSSATPGTLHITSGNAQIGTVSCGGRQQMEGELVEIWAQGGTDATIIVGVVLAILLLCGGNAPDLQMPPSVQNPKSLPGGGLDFPRASA